MRFGTLLGTPTWCYFHVSIPSVSDSTYKICPKMLDIHKHKTNYEKKLTGS